MTEKRSNCSEELAKDTDVPQENSYDENMHDESQESSIQVKENTICNVLNEDRMRKLRIKIVKEIIFKNPKVAKTFRSMIDQKNYLEMQRLSRRLYLHDIPQSQGKFKASAMRKVRLWYGNCCINAKYNLAKKFIRSYGVLITLKGFCRQKEYAKFQILSRWFYNQGIGMAQVRFRLSDPLP